MVSMLQALISFLNNTKNKDLGKIFSLVIGKAVGNDVGAAVSSIAREKNWLEHKDRQNLNNDFALFLIAECR